MFLTAHALRPWCARVNGGSATLSVSTLSATDSLPSQANDFSNADAASPGAVAAAHHPTCQAAAAHAYTDGRDPPTSLLLLALLAVSAAGVEPPQQERNALQAFLIAMPHERDLGWNSPSAPSACLWPGVTCDASNATVVAVRLPGVGLAGALPAGTLGKLQGLRTLSLRSNRLFGPIPTDFFALPLLRSLNLQGNLLSGTIPPDVAGLTALRHLALYDNHLYGEIPAALDVLTELQSLRLDRNRLSGGLPSLSGLRRLEVFNVSDNQLAGAVPVSLARFPPESFGGNLRLCGEPLDKPCPSPGGGVVPPVQEKKKRLSGAAIAAIAVGAAAAALLALILLVLCFVRRRRDDAATSGDNRNKVPTPTTPARGHALTPSTVSGEMTDLTSSKEIPSAAGGGAAEMMRSRLVFMGGGSYSFDLEDLLRASAEVLGNGVAGTTYRAALEDGTTVAVKRLKNVAAAQREFASAVEAVGRVQHRNLLPVRSYYYSSDEKLLVADFLPDGSLSAALHGSGGSGRTPMDWNMRKAPTTASIGVGDGGVSSDLPRWVQSVVREEWTAEVFDAELVQLDGGAEEEMVALLQVAMACAATTPDARPDTSEVVRMVEEIGIGRVTTKDRVEVHLGQEGPLRTIWIAAHLRKLRKNQVTDTDIGVSVDSIIFPEVPIALRLSSHLMVGVVRIYSRKVNYLFHDCSEALLKIKQAFRSAAVDLPPEESTAPYHSITLPETFHLDDFELPEAEFEGDIDHHISSKEQITLQDNPERTGYSTSEFGLDERFGDGSSSHMGFDLEEELLLAKDHPIQLESGDGIIIQGQSSLHLTDMDVDDNPCKDEGAEGYNKMDDEPSTSSRQNQSNADDSRNNIPNWTGYNLRTPDLNDMLFHNEDDAGPSTSYYQPSPFPCDDPASPASPASPEFEHFAAPPSDFHRPAAAHANDAIGAEVAEFRLSNPVQVESSGAVREMDFLRQHCATVDMPPEPQTSNLVATVDKSVVNTDNIAVSGQTLPFKANMGSVPFVQDTSEPRANGSIETYVTGNQTHFNEGSVSVQGYNFLASNVSSERMLSAPYIGFHQTNDLGQLTAEKGITESDGSNKIGSLSRKRHLEDSMPAPESRTTENLSSRPHGQRTTDAISNDDDILASILVGRRTPGLVLDSTPLPPKASSSKRQRLTPKTTLAPKSRTPKRRVKMDDDTVIHADIIRQQLISTEDIRRIRRKAPCTRTEIWMIEKGSLEDDIFREPIFSCMHKDLSDLHYRTYESVSQFTIHNREP
ncbi:hypothetical protein ZWY2020_046984 [Hordeum vulgare]|nr:hypothetical protein ZWY2020_046984 [Hordeum vulgare]